MHKFIGNALDELDNGNIDVLVHGCNTFHTMGAGIARQIASRYPQTLEADKKTIRGDRGKLGTFSMAKTENGFIVNAYTQHGFGGGFGPNVDYEAIKECFEKIAIAFNGLTIGFPLIGCGLAGGRWDIVEPLINQALIGQIAKLIVFNKVEWDRFFDEDGNVLTNNADVIEYRESDIFLTAGPKTRF